MVDDYSKMLGADDGPTKVEIWYDHNEEKNKVMIVLGGVFAEVVVRDAEALVNAFCSIDRV